jgi:hypothetical protein
MSLALGSIGRLLLWGALLIATLVVLYAGWAGFVIAEGKLHLFWTVSRPHYKLSFSIQTPKGKFAAETVVEVEYTESPWWERVPLLDMGEGFAFHRELNGRAAALLLPDGNAVAMLLSGFSFGDDKEHYDVRDIADLLLTKDPRSPFRTIRGRAYRDIMINARTGALVHGGADIPLELLPAMLVFTDATSPRTAHVFDPADPEHWLGAGAKFLGARIDVTNEPVGSDIATLLPWLQTAHPEDMHEMLDEDVKHPLTAKNDPFFMETHGRFLSRYNF